MALIELEDIHKTYTLGEHQVYALRGVSLTIDNGEMVAIIGPSGSGKSTLMNILGCLDKPTSGTYRLDGQEVSTLSDDRLAEIRNKSIGFVFQTFNLLRRTSALRNVELPLIYSKNGGDKRSQKALEALTKVGLDKRAKHKPNQLSGGEQQRVAIARALVNDPSIIMADEPTGNLDTVTSKGIMDLLHKLHEEHGITIILVTHDMEVASHAKRVIRVKDGQIAEFQSVREAQR
ncbi:MAG: ABC transporter ATP-binding protein [Chloroflexi bacterium]|nr:ABC transporter ATP-binding protein [Chloroflexota bacterium]